MTAYYVDTSALIKRYIDEAGSDWLRATIDVQPSPAIIVALLISNCSPITWRRLSSFQPMTV